MQPSFRHLNLPQRYEFLKSQCFLSDEEIALFSQSPLSPEIAELLIENAIGYFPIPMGLATNFRIDGRDRVIPMAVEETSIIAAASATAKWIREHGTLTTWTKGNLIIGQIQLPCVKDPARVRLLLEPALSGLIKMANLMLPGLVGRGGGIRKIEIRELERPGPENGSMMVLHVLCDSCDAMGANLINQVCEALKPEVERLTGELVGLCIVSNLVDSKITGAEVRLVDIDPTLVHGIYEASLFAELDPYRAATHNKGVLNGIDPVLIATGNDWRAVEAGIHAYTASSGRYMPVTRWRRDGSDLVGRIEVPLAVGTVGGVTRVHPIAKVALKILDVDKAEDLARICAAVGLVQNLGALKALSTVGIVQGHMALHASNLALAVGSTEVEISEVRARLKEKIKNRESVGLTLARQILDEIRN